MKLYPCAKINLGLNVTEKRPDGYHNLETVFLPIGVCDELEVETSDVDDVPSEDNLVTKAYRLMAKDFALPHLRISLTKNIPMQAGLGGGSSDCAYTIRAINEICNLGLSLEQMRQYAAKLGADCAFFVDADTENPIPAYATGIGNIITPMKPMECLKGKYLVLIKPNVAVSTKEAYMGITPKKPKESPSVSVLRPMEEWKEWLTNDFEESIFPLLPVLKEVKNALYEAGAIYASMSGSGSTVFGIFDTMPDISGNIKLSSSDYYAKTICL
jgi:4-diphosphocytidyl-2-C-methyl-D-erythritol kinase